MAQGEAGRVWQEYWARNRDHEVILDPLSSAIFREVLAGMGDPNGKKILEAGSGRGIISAELAACGADVHLLDLSEEAIGIARRYFSSRGLGGSFTQGDILALPFADKSFEVVWNAGVLEHFDASDQVRAVKEMARVLRPGGLFISFNPSARAVFYRLGKRRAEEQGVWPYGPETPVESLKGQCSEAGLSARKEYPICFRENLSYLSYLSKHLRSVLKLLFRPVPEQLLLRAFGGYLLATFAEKN